MANEKPILPISRVFSGLFYSFPKLVLTNLLFGVPLAALCALFGALSSIPGLPPAAVELIRLLAVIPVFPFYAGVVQVCAHLVRGEKDVNVLAHFTTAVRENFARFLVHGIVLFAAIVFSFLSIRFYASQIGNNPAMFAPMIISILVALAFLFMFFYLPSMTVTFDIPMKSLYKNSFLMSFGELKKNLIALLGLFFLFIIVTTFLFACMGNAVAIIIVSVILAVAIVPAVATYIIDAAVYERMYAMVVDNTAAVKQVEQKLEDAKQKNTPKQFDSDGIKREFNEKLKSFEIDESADGDEFLFFEGRMIKRSVLIRMKHEVLESEMN